MTEKTKAHFLGGLHRLESEIESYHSMNTPDPDFWNDPGYKAKREAGEPTRMAIIHIRLAIKELDPPPVEYCETCNHILPKEKA